MSESKIVSGKVVSVQAAGHFTAKTGRDAGKNKYKFDVVLDSGEHGQLACLQNELNGTDAPVAIGETHEFNVYTNSNPDFADNWYVRKPKSEGGWKGGASKWTPDPEKENRKERWAKQIMITRQACLNTAASLISAGNGPSTIDNLTGLASQLEEWVKRGIDLKSIVNPTPAPAPAPAAPVANATNGASKPAHIPDMDEVPF